MLSTLMKENLFDQSNLIKMPKNVQARPVYKLQPRYLLSLFVFTNGVPWRGGAFFVSDSILQYFLTQL